MSLLVHIMGEASPALDYRTVVQCQENKDGGKHDLNEENKFLSLQLTPDTSVSFQKANVYIYTEF